MDRDLKGMTVQAGAFVPFGDMRQAVGGFNGEFFVDFHAALEAKTG